MREQIIQNWKYASTFYNGIVFAMRTKSGQGNSGVDDRGATHFLPPDVSNRELGAALIDCLEQSRFILDVDYQAFFNTAEDKRNERSWRDARVKNMGVKSYSQLRQQLANVGVDMIDDILMLQPSNNLFGRDWLYFNDGRREEKDIKMPYPNDPAIIGAALREAFKRCEGTGRDALVFPEPQPD